MVRGASGWKVGDESGKETALGRDRWEAQEFGDMSD